MLSSPVPALGPAFQLGLVVHDIQSAMQHWLGMGAGPFFYFEDPGSVKCTYRGVATDPISSCAFGYSGDMQIEFIQQRNNSPSPYRDFLAAGRDGVQHVAFYANDFDAACRQLEAKGQEVAYKVELWKGDERVHFYENPQRPGLMTEVLSNHPLRRRMHATMQAASRGWEGDRPIRSYDSMLHFAEVSGLL
jgi:catechol 2,3-dioxygenase-like lactoylglutathione lyase family enzyme